MNTKQIKAFTLAALFTGAFTITACNKGTEPGETETERGEIVEEGSLDQGYTSDEYPVDEDTVDLEDKYYDDAEGAVHAGDRKDGGVERDEVDNDQ